LVKNSDIVTLCPTDSFIAAQYTKKENALSRQQNEELKGKAAAMEKK